MIIHVKIDVRDENSNKAVLIQSMCDANAWIEKIIET